MPTAYPPFQRPNSGPSIVQVQSSFHQGFHHVARHTKRRVCTSRTAYTTGENKRDAHYSVDRNRNQRYSIILWWAFFLFLSFPPSYALEREEVASEMETGNVPSNLTWECKLIIYTKVPSFTPGYRASSFFFYRRTRLEECVWKAFRISVIAERISRDWVERFQRLLAL